MRVKLGLTLVGLLSVCSMAAVGCGADDDDEDGSGGRGGSGGTAGSSGKAGKGGTAGEAGAAGKGGTGGSSTGGKGGTSGRGGSGGTAATSGESGAGGQAGAGEGGAVGGEAGASAGEAGAGGVGAVAGEGAGGATGEAGGGGAGGEEPIETASFCSYGCDTTEDCATSVPSAYECHPTRKRCEDPATSCDTTADCVGFASFWNIPCASDAECFPDLEACVAVNGGGRCAGLADPDLGCFFPPEVLTRNRFGTEGTVEVCGSTAAFCDPNHTCGVGCATNEDCTTQFGMGSVCNTATHQCGCTASTECTAPGVSVCNPTTQQCECANDDDCTAVANRPRCVAGVCGCSDATVCNASPFAGAEASCR